MVQSNSETLELQRAQSGHDLWAAVEAAQYARIILPEEPRTDDEANRMQELIDLFSDCSEQWEASSTEDQTVALEQLELRRRALEELELFVYWAIVERRFVKPEGEAVDLPVSVVIIARDREPSVTIDLPTVLDVD